MAQDKTGVFKPNDLRGVYPDDLDEAIRGIREALAPKYDTEGRAFDFYDADLRQQWRADKVRRTPVKTVAEGVEAEAEYVAGQAEEVPEQFRRRGPQGPPLVPIYKIMSPTAISTRLLESR